MAEDRDFMTFDEIRSLLGISEGELESLIRSETLKPNIVELEGKVQQVVPKSLIDEYRRTIATPKPVVEASAAKPDTVSQTIKKLNEVTGKSAEPKKPLELPEYKPKRMVRLQSGELVDISREENMKLFEIERDAEIKAIASRRKSRIDEAMNRLRSGRGAVFANPNLPPRHQQRAIFQKGMRNPIIRASAIGRKKLRGPALALAGGALIGKMVQGSGDLQRVQELDQEMLRRRARQDMLDLLGRKEQKQAVQMSINQNLAKLQMEAPDLYMRAATGRVLPQGAVVIGGAPRADLLNQLGMAMANGQFRQ